MTSELSPLDAYQELIGKTVLIENADSGLLNVVDVVSGKRYWIESTGHLLVFSKATAAEIEEYDDAIRDALDVMLTNPQQAYDGLQEFLRKKSDEKEE